MQNTNKHGRHLLLQLQLRLMSLLQCCQLVSVCCGQPLAHIQLDAL